MKKENKKTYEQPTAEVVVLLAGSALLALSSLQDYEQEDNPWS